MLREFGPAVTEFRAGIIVGNGSLSFEIIRCLTERLPVMICPRWVMTRTQPIAIGDVLDYLVAALAVPESAGEIVEIGGASIETYRSMMLTYARVRGLKRWLLRVPVLTPRLSSYWLNLVTPIPAAITRPLIEGLRTEVVCSSDRAAKLFPGIIPMRYAAAVEEAVSTTGPDKSVAETIGRDVRHVALRRQGYICDVRQTLVHAPAAQVFGVLQGLGGKSGWPYANLLWQMRGWIDRWLGGVGMRRGRSGGATLQRRRLRGLLARRRGCARGKDFVSRRDETTGTSLVAIHPAGRVQGPHASELLCLVRAAGTGWRALLGIAVSHPRADFSRHGKSDRAQVGRPFPAKGRGSSGKLRNVSRDLGTELHECALAQGFGREFELLKVVEREVGSRRCQVEALVADLDDSQHGLRLVEDRRRHQLMNGGGAKFPIVILFSARLDALEDAGVFHPGEIIEQLDFLGDRGMGRNRG